ncbi:hypothetical protein, partial [Cellulomonas sp. HZM]|uniref:hypothetical protein n=1 Tax=Cellulomonas sp. HZM TaxID=1454010 RepID=UPI0009DFB478
MDRRGRPAPAEPAAVLALPALREVPPHVRDALVRQDGVATARQLRAAGFSPAVVGHRVRTGAWRRPFRGVVVLQSGATTWRQLARAALLYCGDEAALSHTSAAYVHGFAREPGGTFVVSVPARRAVRPQPGLVVHRRRAMPFSRGSLRAVDPHDTVLDLLTAVRSDDDVVALLCDAVRAGVSADRVLLHAERRARVPRRALLLAMLDEVADGVESPLELRYVDRVERAHRLPRAVAQHRERLGGRWIRSDRRYAGLGVRVELDGQLAHPFGSTDRDVWRDNAVLIAHGETTLRYRWRHAASDACATAAQVATALRAGGWSGTPRPCSPACAAPPAPPRLITPPPPPAPAPALPPAPAAIGHAPAPGAAP